MKHGHFPNKMSTNLNLGLTLQLRYDYTIMATIYFNGQLLAFSDYESRPRGKGNERSEPLGPCLNGKCQQLK